MRPQTFPSLFLFLRCIHFVFSNGYLSILALVDQLTVPDLQTTTVNSPLFWPGSPHVYRLPSIFIRPLHLESGWKRAQRCDGVCVCVSSGSVTGQEWAAAAGLQLMTTVSIYLLLNISRIGGDGCFSFSFHFYMSRQAMCPFAVCIVEATECTVHTNRANSFVQQPRDVQNDCNFLVFFR